MLRGIVSVTRGATVVAFVLCLAACGPSVDRELSADDRTRIVGEITRTLDEYKEAVTHKELSAIKGFWSDADGFVFAGDGTILGGSKEWYDKLDWYHQDTGKWNHWVWRTVRVEPLGAHAASATVEFENSRTTTAGNTLKVKGAWTYVFTKHDGKWRVIQTNGTHVPF